MNSRSLVNAIFEAQEQLEVTNAILSGLLSCQYAFTESQLENFTLWILETFNSPKDMDVIFNYILANTLFTSSPSLSHSDFVCRRSKTKAKSDFLIYSI